MTDETTGALSAPQLAALLSLSQALSKHRDRADVSACIAGAIDGVLPVDRVAVFLPESGGMGCAVYAASGVAPRAARIPDQSLAARVIRDRTAIVQSTRDAVREQFPAAYEQLVEDDMQSVAVLPLLVHERCLGALELMARGTNAFDASTPRFLEEIASCVAVALDTCIAYEQLARLDQEQQALLAVNAAVSRHLGRDELFGAMAGCLRDLVPTERFGIELPIEGNRLQGHLLTPGAAHGEPTRPTVLPAAGTACDWVLRNRRWLVTAAREELRERFPITFEVMNGEGMESLCAMPLVSGEHCRGVLFFMAARRGAYEMLRRDFLDQVAAVVAVALDDCLAHEEVRSLRDRLAAENVYLQEEIQQVHNFTEIIGRSAALNDALSRIDMVAATNATVLILGETGTGKELIARAIHDRSPRRARPLVKVNCAALSAGLVESELFGHVKGAFTGALAARTGRFELANGGTIFLDEIGELPLETQVKLLRVLQEQEFEPVGSSQTRRVDVRVIAATNRDLEQAIADRRFRSDLFFRINVFPIRMPPVRERREDIPLLTNFFVARLARDMGKPIEGVSRQAMERLIGYDWPGNVRELENIVERAMVLAKGPLLELPSDWLLGAAESTHGAIRQSATAAPPASSLEEVQKRHILQALERCAGVIEGPRGAAHLLGMQPSTLRSRLKKLGLQQRPARAEP
jgi:formate hydrogenlyase transcriptional activator